MIYTLGASFTKWYWPTWSDWLNVYNGPVTNWAFAGYGNQHIHWILLDKLNHITPDDEIIIMWGTSNNNTQWYDREWVNEYQCEGFFPQTNGRLWFTKDKPWLGMYKFHPEHNISLSQMIIGNFHTVLQTQLLLDKIGCKYKMAWSQNPWLDIRPTFKPEFDYNWDKKSVITPMEYENAMDILELHPVQTLLNQIDWNKFVEPVTIFDPTTYTGIWEFGLSKKEYVLANHISDNHPNTLVAHDYLVEKIYPQVSKYKDIAKQVASQCEDMYIPEFKSTDYVAEPDEKMCLIDIQKYV